MQDNGGRHFEKSRILRISDSEAGVKEEKREVL